ncbi:hypothetical protein RUND412_003799 [Rhizina undulata]
MQPRIPALTSLCRQCLLRRLGPSRSIVSRPFHRPIPSETRSIATAVDATPKLSTAEFQKDLKQQRKQRNKELHKKKGVEGEGDWIVTCGLEIHAQLNTTRKLFSDAKTSTIAPPNTHIAPFDASLPGTQPRLNPSILLPALRAALALNCKPEKESRFDRKHYFYWDQPAGYQITQFYHPLAKEGFLTLYSSDDVDIPEELEETGLKLGIKQVQIEQDTGKTIASPPNSLIDLNRVGAPLVEIITHPFDIPNPAFAAGVMRKIQAVLRAVDACVLGMEWGGLRADVNVSVRRRGVQELGQRCEIKNLSSLKAVEDAVTSEVKRQVAVLEAGGVVEGETRGWDAEKAETKRLRGKEGEVDYRYMPDPDLRPVVLSQGLIEKVAATLPPLPDQVLAELLSPKYGVRMKDAKTLMLWDKNSDFQESGPVGYFREVVSRVEAAPIDEQRVKKLKHSLGDFVLSWIIHELGGQLRAANLEWKDNPVDRINLSDLISYVLMGKITSTTAKTLLPRYFPPTSDTRSIPEIVEQEDLAIKEMSKEELDEIVEKVLAESSHVVEQIHGLAEDDPRSAKKKKGLLMFIVGKAMRETGGRVEAGRIEEAITLALRKIMSSS